jgi:predicted ATP-binding protein involved in virulence
VKIKKLQVANLRAFEQAEFEFTPGMNLLVGVNGMGKTTVLDVLRACLSRIIHDMTNSRVHQIPFVNEDIRVQADFMTVDLTFEIQGEDITFSVHKNRESSVPLDSDNLREQVIITKDREIYSSPNKSSDSSIKSYYKMKTKSIIGVFFSTKRSIASYSTASTKKASGGRTSAYAEALVNRELRLSEIAHWMHVQEKLGEEHPLGLKHLSALQKTAENFLPEFTNLRVEMTSEPRLIVDKGKTTLYLHQLSDGEKGMFALVLDLAKRLSQANPQLDDPIKDGSAIVLIDEIDLHLHPKWQRIVVKKVTETFPNCQFIATTHSPQIIAAVEPQQVQFISNSKVIRPSQTLGIDSNWILSNLMDAEERPIESSSAIKEVELLIRDGDFDGALEAIAAYKKQGLDLPDWSVLEARIASMEMMLE